MAMVPNILPIRPDRCNCATPNIKLKYWKDYSGVLIALFVGTASQIKMVSDDPRETINGSSLVINIVNKGSLPITSFLRNEDDALKIRLTHIPYDLILFDGFVAQDDCQEDMVDYAHIITLTANDGLGFLKDIPLNKAYAPGYNELQISTEDFSGKKTLLDIIKHCIYCTGLQLSVAILSQLRENTQVSGVSFLEQIYVESDTFLNNDTDYLDCYSVLSAILQRYNLQIFQSRGGGLSERWML